MSMCIDKFMVDATWCAFAFVCRINGKHWFTRQESPLSKEGENPCPRRSWTESCLPMLTGLNIKLSNMVNIRLELWGSQVLWLKEMELDNISNCYDVQKKLTGIEKKTVKMNEIDVTFRVTIIHCRVFPCGEVGPL